jgi:nicotinamidase-related amidase
MNRNTYLSKENTGLLVVDVQEKLLPHMERGEIVLHTMQQAVKGFQILGLPIVVTEQYPQGLGHTVPALKQCLKPNHQFWTKTTFSCMNDQETKRYILSLGIEQWIVMGLEAHICILQTAKGLLAAGKQVVILNDAITSRSIFDFSTAIAEMRDLGIRITSTETALFELVRDSKNTEFKQISKLVKSDAVLSRRCCMAE